jgi:hypothetical protein
LKCRVCSRGTQAHPPSEYCELHEKAHQNVRRKFEVWKKASGLEWKEYLIEIAKNPFTGAWAKEVAENLLLKETKHLSGKKNI